MTPREENMSTTPGGRRQDAGYRACRRCRPDTVPGSPEGVGRTRRRAMRLIGDGVVEREGVPGVAARLGYSTRQLQRITLGELGASPLAIARSQRAHTARILIETSPMPLSDVAYAAGFGSIRSFNEAIKVAFDRTPTQLRDLNPNLRTLRGGAAGESASSGGLRGTKTVLGRVDVRLAFRPPLASGPLFGHLAATAVPGVEEWRDGAYRRTLRLPHGPGIVALAPRTDHVAATLWLSDPRDLTPAIGRCRRLLDLDADPIAVDAALGADPALAPLVAAGPGARIPRTVDASELALRIVSGQQVPRPPPQTTGRLVEQLGEPVIDPAGDLTRLFPTRMPSPRSKRPRFRAARGRGARHAGVRAGVRRLELGPGADWDEAGARWRR